MTKVMISIRQLSFMALALMTIVVSAPKQASAAPLEFSRKIYDAFDELATHDADKYERVGSLLMLAKDQTSNPNAREEVQLAVQTLVDLRKEESRDVPTENVVQLVRTHLYSALTQNRVQLGKSYKEEPQMLERFLMSHLFPEQEMGRDPTGDPERKKIALTFQNIEPNLAMSLIAQYIVDGRAIKYDNEVAKLITGTGLTDTTPSPGKSASPSPSTSASAKPSGPDSPVVVAPKPNPPTNGDAPKPFPIPGRPVNTDPVGDPAVVFMLPSISQVAGSPKELASTVANLKDMVKHTIKPNMPIKASVVTIGNKVVLNLEVVGFQYIAMVENARKLMMMASSNRYLFKMASLSGNAAMFLKTTDWLGIQQFQDAANKAADALEWTQNTLQSNTVSGRWYRPDEQTVIAKLERSRDFNIAALKKTVEAKDEMETAEQYAARQADVAAKIAAEGTKFDAAKSQVLTLVKTLKNSPEFVKLSREAQQDAVLAMAKKAGGVKFVPTLPMGLSIVSGLITSYYITEWVIQSNREKDPVLRQELNEKYGVKVICNLMYLVPVLGEAEFAIDMSAFVVEHGALAIHLDYKIPRTEDLFHKLMDLSGDMELYFLNSSRMKIFIGNAYLDLQVPYGWARTPQGNYIDTALLKYGRDQSPPDQKAALKEKLLNHVREDALKYLQLVYAVANFSDGKYNQDAAVFEQDLFEKLVQEDHGYFDYAASVLSTDVEKVNPDKLLIKR